MRRKPTCIQKLARRVPFFRLGLGDLIFVMRELQIESAAVDVNHRLVEDVIGHDDAFGMPSWPSKADVCVELDSLVVCQLPEHKIERVLLFVVDFDPLSGLQVFDTLLGKPPVLGDAF